MHIIFSTVRNGKPTRLTGKVEHSYLPNARGLVTVYVAEDSDGRKVDAYFWVRPLG